MDRVVLFCKKCVYESVSFLRFDNYGFDKALNQIKTHMTKEHPRVRQTHRNFNWRTSGGTE